MGKNNSVAQLINLRQCAYHMIFIAVYVIEED